MDFRRAAAIGFTILSWTSRLIAIGLGALTVLLCFPSAAARLNLIGLVIDIANALPDVISGYGLITSPFGGVFRFDFACTMAIMLALDYIFQRISRSLR